MMFWSCYTMYMKDSSYMFGQKTAAEKMTANNDLKDRNSEYYLQQQIIWEQFLYEQSKKSLSWCLKRILKPNGVLIKHNKESHEGINWYQYQMYVLLPQLIPFIKKVITQYSECFLVQNDASAHCVWQQAELLKILRLIVLSWLSNSLNLNQIELCWYHLKHTVSKRPYVSTVKQTTIDTYNEEWQNLEGWRIEGWCENMRCRMKRVWDARDNNNFHGWQSCSALLEGLR